MITNRRKSVGVKKKTPQKKLLECNFHRNMISSSSNRGAGSSDSSMYYNASEDDKETNGDGFYDLSPNDKEIKDG